MKSQILQLKIRTFIPILIGLLCSLGVYSQNITVKGRVQDAQTGEPIIGASILVKGTNSGTMTDIDGNFQIQASQGATISVSYIGYASKDVPAQANVTISLDSDAIALTEVVAIGYGTVRKKDATGSVVAIKAEEMNKGLTVSPQDMLAGKIAGVSVINGGGQPGGTSTIRIRGGSSLSATNDPLVVIDGVVMSGYSMDGLSNALSTLNPNDIETFTVLKDASATAIYGSRASNGVIIITTKKGKIAESGETSVRLMYDGNVSVSTPRNKYDVLDAGEYRDFINNYPDVVSKPTMLQALNLYPGVDTDWQDEIYRTAIGTDHSLSAFGSIKDFMPYRASIGYTNQNGILDTSNFERYTGTIALSPSLFDDHLKINVNAKGIHIKNRFADTGAIGAAVNFDPTKPVTNGNTKYGGYYTWTDGYDPNGPKAGSTTINPVSLLKMKDDTSTANSFVGNAQFEYKLHFFPDLKVNLNLGMENTKTDGETYIQPNAPSNYNSDLTKTGSNSTYVRHYKNKLLDFYGQYVKDVASIRSRFDIMAGYSYQDFKRDLEGETWYLSGEEDTFGQRTTLNTADPFWETGYTLISFYGRFNYTFSERYLLTFTLRDDATSRFSKDNRWGLFPSVALGWRINDEAFLRENQTISNLKLRLGWGVTGQQDIGRGDYPYLNSYKDGLGGAMMPVYDAAGNVTWINVISVTAANPNLKWEETTTWNAGLDYGFLNNRINGAIDFYYRKTKDLINNEVNVPAGTNFAETVPSNIGTLVNKGVEFSINATPINTKDLTWDLGYNIAFNDSKITQLTYNDANATSPGKRYEDLGEGGKTIKIHSVNYAPSMYYVYEQIYDENGKPIEGAYVDRNGDGVINDKDLYQYKKPTADVLMGFYSKVLYKDWDFGFNGRVSLGNYNYNRMAANAADLSTNGIFAHNELANKPQSAMETGFQSRQRMSDYYVQNASFLKIDNITIGYTVNKFFTDKLKARFYGTVQNPIVITQYDGLDPEVENGIDNNVYPRPLTFIFGVNLNF